MHNVVFTFEGYVFDSGRRLLTRRGRPVDLGQRALGVLELLLFARGEVVEKRELLDTVWSDVAVVEDNLVQAVHEIRAALGDDPRHPCFVQTVHRRGYRFMAPVHESEPDVLAGGQNNGGEARSPRYGRLLWLAAACAVMLAGGLAVLGTTSARRTDPFAHLHLHKVAPGFMKPAVSHGGDLLAAVAAGGEGGGSGLFLLSRNGGQALPLAKGFDVRGPSPVFSADDSEIWFTTYAHLPGEGLVAQVRRVPVLGGTPRLLLNHASAASPDPDGRSIVYAAVGETATSLRLRRPDGSEIELAPVGYWPRWSPDGRWIAFTTSNPEGGDGELFVVRPGGTGRRRLTPGPSQLYGLSWTPDSKWLLFGSDLGGGDDIWAVGVDGSHLHQLTEGPGSCSAPVIEPSKGDILFAYGTQRVSVVRVALDEKGQEVKVLAVMDDLFDLDVDRAHERLAWVGCDQGCPPRLEVLELADGRRQTVSVLGGERCRWCPDGRSVLLTAPSPDRSSWWIWKVSAEGGMAQPVLSGKERWEEAVALPEMGWLVAVRRLAGGSEELDLVEPGRGVRHALATSGNIQDLRFSPDGRSVAWSGGLRPAVSTATGIWVQELKGAQCRRLAVDGASPTWENDGRHLLFLRSESVTGVWRVPATGGNVTLLWRPEGPFEGMRLEHLAMGAEGVIYASMVTEEPALFALASP